MNQVVERKRLTYSEHIISQNGQVLTASQSQMQGISLLQDEARLLAMMKRKMTEERPGKLLAELISEIKNVLPSELRHRISIQVLGQEGSKLLIVTMLMLKLTVDLHKADLLEEAKAPGDRVEQSVKKNFLTALIDKILFFVKNFFPQDILTTNFTIQTVDFLPSVRKLYSKYRDNSRDETHI